MELTAGTKIGIFTIVRQIGVGGMSEVYLVKDNLGRPFALKIMSRRLSFECSFRQRFEQEAKIMATLNHPNIVQMHSYFEAEGRFCLAMEYVEGGSLKDLTRRIGPIPEKRALNILKQIAEALSYAHGKGVIHRDVKPSNILLGENDNVKVMDFGIARMAEGPGFTMTGTQVGTLVYMSPEQIKDSKHIDERTDIYSLGVSFYEMLTGKPPYDESDSNDFEIRVSIVQNELPNPRNIYPHIGEKSLSLLDALTRKNKEKRLALSELLAGKLPKKRKLFESPEEKIEKEDKYPASNPPRRKRLSLTKVLLLGGFLVISFVIVGYLVYNEMYDREEEPIVEEVVEEYDEEELDWKKIAPEMIYVKGGSFLMGSFYEGEKEEPVHQVTISSFGFGKYEVTQKEWVEVMNKNPSEFKGANLPIHNVSWYDAVEYCNKRSIHEGLTPCYSSSGTNTICDWNANGYRLPTEAEWEYAARGGLKSKGYKYSGSNDIDKVAWYEDNSGSGAHDVGTKSPNELGVHDMSGNIWEWCWDIYGAYPSSHQTNPHGANSGSRRVLRGGSWIFSADYCTVSLRARPNATYSGSFIGFRVCRGSL